MQAPIPSFLPTYPRKLQLKGMADRDTFVSLQRSALKTSLYILKCAFVCSPKDLHGTAIVTKELKQRAKLNARLITISSFINTIGIAPFIGIALGSFGLLTLPFTAIFLGGINAASNHCGAIAARHAPGYRANAWYGLGGFVALNAFLTAFTGPGIVMFTNKPAVQQYLATSIVEKQRAKLDILKPTAELDELKAQINEAQTTLQQIVAEEGEVASRQNPEWQRLHLSLYGSYEERNRDWTTVKTPNLPLTQKLERLEMEHSAPYREKNAELDELLSRRIDYGDDLHFLQAEMPQSFNANFQPDYQVKSPTTELAIAMELFINDLKMGRFEQLAFPMLMAGISLILSATACLLTYAFARSPAVQASFDPKQKALVRQAIQILRQRAQQTPTVED